MMKIISIISYFDVSDILIYFSILLIDQFKVKVQEFSNLSKDKVTDEEKITVVHD